MDKWLQMHSQRYRLRRICKAIGLKPYGWQMDFALDLGACPQLRGARGNGKTTAVMLRMLMRGCEVPYRLGKGYVGLGPFFYDPSFDLWPDKISTYVETYSKMYTACDNAGVRLDAFRAQRGTFAAAKKEDL